MTAGMTFSPNTTPPPTLDYLLVAGGGGGGRYYGGGGGAGGLLTSTGYSVSSNTTYTVTIGTGGTGALSTGIGTAGTNSVVSSNNSYSFNGSSQYLTANNAALALGTGNFTVEAWVYTTVSSGTQSIYDTRQTDGTTTGFYFGLYASNTLLFYTSGAITINAGTVPINTWTHIALVRVGNTFTVYVNGTSVGTATNSNNFTNTIVQIGSSSTVAASSANYYTGYLSNLRTVKGVSVYTGNFTVPTSPLTATQSAGTNISAITGVQTSLLTLQSATIIDNSTYALSITNTGGVAFSSNTPFTVNPVGGGYGGGNSSASAGGPGGSGGGAGGPSSASGGAGTAGQGNNGGTNTSGGGAGGGGAGAAGGTSSTSSAGTGGVGLQLSISGTATYYAGGGGGSAGLGVLTNGGAGGGGNGATDTAGSFASAGAANTGGGGGGGSNPNSDPTWSGKNGGSGIAIIRYADDYVLATTTGSPTFINTGGYNIYTWTSSGSITF